MNHFKLPCLQFCTGVVRWLAVGAWMIALCVPGTLFAQSHEITGKVLDENDMPVVGANVIVDGTTIGTNSGLDGSFKLTVSPPLTKRCPSCTWGTKPPNSYSDPALISP